MVKTNIIFMFLMLSKIASAECILSCSISGDSAYIYAMAVSENCEKSGPVSLNFSNDKEESVRHELSNLNINVPKSKKLIIKQIKPIPANMTSCDISWSNSK